jgi:hypothetical protein
MISFLILKSNFFFSQTQHEPLNIYLLFEYRKTFKVETNNQFANGSCHIEFKPNVKDNGIIKILLPNKEVS